MSNHHYHVISSLTGCLPATNEFYETQAEAISNLAEIVRELRDSGNRLRGNLAAGYFVLTHKTDALVDIVCIEKCDMNECREQHEQELYGEIEA